MTLGNRLRHNIAEAQRLKLDREQRADREAREKLERHRREVSIAFDAIKSRITSSIEDGSVPNPIRLPRVLDAVTSRWDTPISSPGHRDHGQWQAEMDAWACDQGLVLDVVHDHDGVGMESWWNIVVNPA